MVNFSNAEFEMSVGNLLGFPKSNVPEVVFSGKSNVGKSSLINKILNRKSLARVSSKPGKTININLYNLKTLRFIDLPGYGYAKVSQSEKNRWSKLVEGYFNLERSINLVVQIVDVRHSISPLDEQMLDFLQYKNLPFVIVFSKVDKLGKTKLEQRKEQIEVEFAKYNSVKKIFFSSVNGNGLDEFKALISKSCEN